MKRKHAGTSIFYWTRTRCEWTSTNGAREGEHLKDDPTHGNLFYTKFERFVAMEGCP